MILIAFALSFVEKLLDKFFYLLYALYASGEPRQVAPVGASDKQATWRRTATGSKTSRSNVIPRPTGDDMPRGNPLRQIELTVTLAGAGNALSGSVTTDTEIRGWFVAIHIRKPSTVISSTECRVSAGAPEHNVLVNTGRLSNWSYPTDDSSGINLFPIIGNIVFAVSNANAGTYTATIIYEEVPF
ncbi:MAG: hypothetical protein OXE95_07890 [Chloroflexi bacterium]|nr:hypothetical protein [Chloroflexota bacterium]